ncbi:MAG: thioredoxin family protein [Planctomycetaceae bacterium]|jgi:YHS domain-containing protein|nr:thioredoxin family protein [Planctomycetaceae bacterium]
MTLKAVKTLLVLCLFVPVSFAQEAVLRWETNFDAAAAKAQQTQRFLFVHIVGNPAPSAQGVDPSRQMDAEVFTTPEVITGLTADYISVRINVSEQPQLAKKFNVTALPTDLVLRPDGQLVHRRQGSITAARFCQYLVFLKNTAQAAAQTPVKPSETAPAAQAAAAPQVSAQAIPPVESLHDPFTRQAVPAAVPHTAANPLREAEPVKIEPARPVLEIKAPVAPPPVQPPAAAGYPQANRSVSAPPVSPAPMEKNAAGKQHIVEVPLALEGFCPVTLSLEERWVSGNPVYCTMYQGAVFRFTSQETLLAFAKEPARFVPAAMGEDIVLMVDRNKRVNGSREFGAWFQSRVFLFSSQETLDAFAAKPEYYAEIAAKYETARRDTHYPVTY